MPTHDHLADPNVECTPYNYPPVSNALNLFPPIWGPASIVLGDTAAGAKWASIQGSVPDIPPKVRAWNIHFMGRQNAAAHAFIFVWFLGDAERRLQRRELPVKRSRLLVDVLQMHDSEGAGAGA